MLERWRLRLYAAFMLVLVTVLQLVQHAQAHEASDSAQLDVASVSSSVSMSQSMSSPTPVDPEAIDPNTGQPYIPSLTLSVASFSLLIATALVVGVLFALSFHLIWGCFCRASGVRRTATQGYSRESLRKEERYVSRQMMGNKGCAIM